MDPYSRLVQIPFAEDSNSPSHKVPRLATVRLSGFGSFLIIVCFLASKRYTMIPEVNLILLCWCHCAGFDLVWHSLFPDICGLVGVDSEKVIHFVENRPFNDQRYFLDDKKLKQLGWEVRFVVLLCLFMLH